LKRLLSGKRFVLIYGLLLREIAFHCNDNVKL
jgi:hypothetical protein